MAESEQLIEAFDARARRRAERRDLFRMVLGTAAAGGAFAYASAAQAQTVTDSDVLNFALNLEYLEANFYSFAVNGAAIAASLTTGTGKQGVATGGHVVPFSDPAVKAYALEIASDELAHVAFLRTALGSAAVAQPTIDVGTSPTGAFSSAAQAAGLVPAGTAFDPYASDNNFPMKVTSRFASDGTGAMEPQLQLPPDPLYGSIQRVQQELRLEGREGQLAPTSSQQ